MQKLKVGKREINLTHFYGIFYLLASLGLSNPARFDWLCQDLPIPAASLCSLCSESRGLLSTCRLFFLHPQATRLKEMLIYVSWCLPWQSFSLCSRFTVLGDSSLSANDESTHSRNNSAWYKWFAKILKDICTLYNAVQYIAIDCWYNIYKFSRLLQTYLNLWG